MNNKNYSQKATVFLVSDEDPWPKLQYVHSDLKKAYEWVLVHSRRLKPGERYDIYYRAEEVKEGG